jgi:hypothetical protein
MTDQLEEIRILLKAAIEAEISEQRRQHRQFGLDASDVRAFSNIHPAQPVDAKVRVVVAVEAVEAGRPKPSNWVDPSPLVTPYVDQVDRIALAFARREREAALRERIKELEEEHQRLLRLRGAQRDK